jgi:hypothetical protein
MLFVAEEPDEQTLSLVSSNIRCGAPGCHPHKRNCNASIKDTSRQRPFRHRNQFKNRAHGQTPSLSRSKCPIRPNALSCVTREGAANVSLPLEYALVKERRVSPARSEPPVRRGRRLVGAGPWCVNAITALSSIFSKHL